MHLSSLWNQYHPLLKNPVEFLGKINEELAAIIKEEGSFATAVCGLLDWNKQLFRFASAGGPEVVLMHENGTYECLRVPDCHWVLCHPLTMKNSPVNSIQVIAYCSSVTVQWKSRTLTEKCSKSMG